MFSILKRLTFKPYSYSGWHYLSLQLGIILTRVYLLTLTVNKFLILSFFNLHKITKIRRTLSQSDAEKLVHALISSRLDNCSAILAGCPDNSPKILQLSTAARILASTRRDHISLSMKIRIQSKIIHITNKAQNGINLSFIKDLTVSYDPTKTATAGLLVIPEFPGPKWGAEYTVFRLLLGNQLLLWL